MGVYIKGLHKAKYCIDCPLMMCNADGDWCALQDAETNESFKSWDDMRKHCPLVEIEVPHGRLIDADALIDEGMDIYHLDYFRGVMSGYSRQMIDCTPTVLESEGKDDG